MEERNRVGNHVGEYVVCVVCDILYCCESRSLYECVDWTLTYLGVMNHRILHDRTDL